MSSNAKILEELIWRAKIADHASRPEDIIKILKKVVELDLTKHLTGDSRNIFATAYKMLISRLRSCWRLMADKNERSTSEPTKNAIVEYQKKIEKEIRELCMEVITTIDTYLMPKIEEADIETKIYYLKTKADYYRYFSEILTGEELKDTIEKAKVAYAEAFELSTKNLARAHPTRLGLELNYSVFFYETINEPEKAIELANDTLNKAECELGELEEKHYRESSLILHLIRENLGLWAERSDEPSTKKESDRSK